MQRLLMLAVCAFFVRVVWSVINFVHCLVSRGLCGWKKIKTPKGRKKNKVLVLRWRKTSSFANFGLCVGLCGLQMCLLCVLVFHQSKLLFNSFSTFVNGTSSSFFKSSLFSCPACFALLFAHLRKNSIWSFIVFESGTVSLIALSK